MSSDASQAEPFSARHYVLGIFDDSGEAMQARDALVAAGIPEPEIMLCIPPQDIDSTGEVHGFFAQLQRGIQYLLSESDHLTDYEEAAAGGACVVGVHPDTAEQREHTEAILAQFRAHSLKYFGDWVVETIAAPDDGRPASG